jgi:transketolase
VWVKDGDNDLEAIEKAIKECQEVKDKPSMIRLTTTIGYGSKLQGTGGVHGNPLKEDDRAAVKEKFGFDPSKSFVVPQEVYDMYHKHADEGAAAEQEWNKLLEKYAGEYKTEAADLKRRLTGELPEGWQEKLPTYKVSDPAIASRKLSETVIEKIYDVIPEFVSGSADLTGSNNTRWKSAVDFQPPNTGIGEWSGRYMRYGVREHSMAAIMNGLEAYGTLIPAGGTFLNFVSYAAGAVRLSALSQQRVIYVATHDSIGLGEDGPTHQPIETLAHFRALPNMMVWRPADGNETSAAYYVALTSKHTPSILALTRQNLPQLEGSTIENAIKGGYVALEDKEADVTLISTGSEVSICLEAVKTLKEKNLKARVVSMPCTEVFDAQSKDYKLSVIPDGIPAMSVEVMSTLGWEKYSHEQFGLNRFGASGPYKEVYAVSNDRRTTSPISIRMLTTFLAEIRIHPRGHCQARRCHRRLLEGGQASPLPCQPRFPAAHLSLWKQGVNDLRRGYNHEWKRKRTRTSKTCLRFQRLDRSSGLYGNTNVLTFIVHYCLLDSPLLIDRSFTLHSVFFYCETCRGTRA